MEDSQKRETRRDRGEEKKIKGLRSYIQPCLVAVSTQTVLAKHLALVAHNVTVRLTNKSLIILPHFYYLRSMKQARRLIIVMQLDMNLIRKNTKRENRNYVEVVFPILIIRSSS